ncbi:MAG: glycoside hydrolase family 95 protein [Bacillota bacterium]|nr:glycoside hydrolase family 95 protein [Bacillota bacterium]NLL88471.1 glycoside hydrolase family 95 protein [Bacillota bacterium]
MNNEAASRSHNLVLWYQKPAREWVEALPIGNGRLGAMIFGDPKAEHLQVNEETIWTGKPHDYAHKGAYKYLEAIRTLIASGRQRKAEELAMEHFMSVPLRQEEYQPFCDLYLSFPDIDPEQVGSYHRELDLDQALAKVAFEHKGTTYCREYLASYPHQVIVARLSADKDSMISFTVALGSAHQDVEVAAGPEGLALRGRVQPDGIRFEARLVIQADGGTVTIDSGSETAGIKVSDANSATIMLVGASSFVSYKDISGNPSERCARYLQRLQGAGYDQIRKEHINDYQQLFRTVSFDLGAKPLEQPTGWRIAHFEPDLDLQLVSLYFQFGRYLMISGSRPGSLPLNLQGIWNDQLRPPWGSKYTTNINLEMNYWPAEAANLASCHQPLFEMLKMLRQTGAVVAKEHYNCRGWVLHHNTDIWGGAAPINDSNHGIWPTGGAWLCSHIWQHYLYHRDRGFLAEHYPIMRDAALFFIDYLVEDEKTGWLISTPSNSPEQGGLVAGPAMDHQIIRELMRNCTAASEILDCDHELREQWQSILERIAPDQIGKYGQLQEWIEDLDDPNNKHRHVSHLYALFPGSEISPDIDPRFSEAAKKSLEFRGDKGTGWSMAWKINLWARLLDGDRAYKLLAALIREGTYPNMFDAHPPFQIDGNFGAISGIMEMLVQSQLGRISLLPALPKAWPEGRITGICLPGGFTIDISWAQGRLSEAIIHSRLGGECRIQCREPVGVFDGGKQVQVRSLENGIYAFAADKNQVYRVQPVRKGAGNHEDRGNQ